MVAPAYLDTNVLVALLVGDALITQATETGSRLRGELIVSDFAAAEFAAVVGRLVRIGQFENNAGQSRLILFDRWLPAMALRVPVAAEDVVAAETLLRRFSLGLRAPAALHSAIARRLDATLVTFDRRMEQAALALGVATEGIVP